MADPAEIAERLTEAMKAALLGAHLVSSYGTGRNIYHKTPSRTADALQRRCLVRGWMLTSTGLAVREYLAHLKDQQQ